MDISSIYPEVQDGIMIMPLVSPFVSGDGSSFQSFRVFPKKEGLHSGMIAHDALSGTRIIVAGIFEVPDFFENIQVAECFLVTNNPKDRVSPNLNILIVESSARTGHNLPSI